MVDVKRPALAVAIVFFLVTLAMLLVGCGKEPPVAPFVTTEQPAIPAECVAQQRPIPKLPDGDVDDKTAAKDSERLAGLLKVERANRRACEERLRILFPQKDKTA